MPKIPPKSSDAWLKLVVQTSSLKFNSFATKMLLTRIIAKEKASKEFSSESYELLHDFFSKNYDVPKIAKDLEIINTL